MDTFTCKHCGWEFVVKGIYPVIINGKNTCKWCFPKKRKGVQYLMSDLTEEEKQGVDELLDSMPDLKKEIELLGKRRYQLYLKPYKKRRLELEKLEQRRNKMKRFDIDLNKLELEELEALIKMVKKSEQEKEDEVIIDLEKPTVVEQHVPNKNVQYRIWKPELTAELYRLKVVDKINSTIELTKILNKKYNVNFTRAQVQAKIDSMKMRKQWGRWLLEGLQVKGIREKSKLGNIWDERFTKTEELMEKNNVSFGNAYMQASGRVISTDVYSKYRQWKGHIPVKRKKYTRKRKTKKYYDKWNKYFDKLLEVMERDTLALSQAIEKVYGRKAGGSDYKKFKEYCKRKNLSARDIQKKYDGRGKQFRRKLVERIVVSKPELSEFPELDYIKTNTFRETLQNILKKMISDKGITMNLQMEGFLIGIENNIEWEGFLQDFIKKSSKVAQFFGVRNKFKITKIGKDNILGYEV
jgi:hypothetical protein